MKAKKQLKADKAICTQMRIDTIIKVGQKISWTIYRGPSAIESKTAEDYIKGFFKTGNLMPMCYKDFGLDVQSVSVEYDDADKVNIVTIEGVIQKLKGVQTK